MKIKNILRQKLEDFLVWVLTKVNIQRLKSISIDDNKIVIGLSKYIKDDGNYHNVSASINCWIKVSPKRKIATEYDDIAVWVDGKVAKKLAKNFKLGDGNLRSYYKLGNKK